MRVLLLLFQFGFLLFLFLLWLMWPKLPKLCWIVVVRVGTFDLFLTLEEMLSTFTIEVNDCCDHYLLNMLIYIWSICCLSYAALIMLRHVPTMPAFWRVFIIKGCWILSRAFSASIEITLWFLSLNLLMWWYHIDGFATLRNPRIPGIKPTWSWCMNFLIWCWILFARI